MDPPRERKDKFLETDDLIGQSILGLSQGAFVLKCSTCNHTDLVVGIRDYTVVIRCPRCDIDECLADG